MTAAMVEDPVTPGIADLLAASGATYRELDYWVRRGFVRAEQRWHGSGYPRSFPPGETEVVTAIVRLRAAGLPLDLAAKLARSGPGRHELATGATLVLDHRLWTPAGPGVPGPRQEPSR